MESNEVERFRREVVAPAIYPRRLRMDVAAHQLRSEPVSAADALCSSFEPFKVGQEWGGMWDTTWFLFQAQVPAEWAHPVAVVHLGGSEIVGFSAEGLVYDEGGTPLQGLHHRHREVSLGGDAAGGEIRFYVEAAANPVPRWDLKDWSEMRPEYGGTPLYVLKQADIADADRNVEALYIEMGLLLQLATGGTASPERRDQILKVLSQACSDLDPDDIAGTARASREELAPSLEQPSSCPHRVVAVGHAHIDSAWLWPARETKRKCARTFANQLRLLERYPDHHFVCSQAAQYQWMKESYPGIFEQIKDRVAEGRWEPVGGMWVEPDSNIPSGESLVRQLVFGKRFFIDEFGFESHELWIPDVFGYCAALPQIATMAGVSSIVTQKMSWNDTNQFPHSTFWWEGHDGSRLLAHFPPANTYNGEFSVRELVASRDNNKDRDRTDTSLYPFGFGDGGGGPTSLMLETASRTRNLDGLPRVEVGTAAGFLETIDRTQLATWVGELYLEFHRGTFTTHADVKLANRRGEEALRAAELWSVAANVDHTAVLERAWKLLLFNQFHDIIPGSSIAWVYDDAAADHAEVMRVAGGAIETAQRRLSEPDEAEWIAFNQSSYDRLEIVDCEGTPAVARIPGCGWDAVEPIRNGELERHLVSSELGPARAGEDWIENDHLRVTWDPNGLLTSVWDRQAGREVLAEGERGNVFQIHEDHPKSFDAWEVDRDYLDFKTDIVDTESVEVIELGPLRAAARIVRRFGDSRISQVMSLCAGGRRLEFQTEVDWRESHRFLKVAFPVAVRSARATYEIQHGHIERPTVENTSWDEARFEVCGHRWADLGEPGYGVALINDCKYGYDIRGNVMRLSLLRAPGYPDPKADRGQQRFGYALFPHAGDLREAGVVEQAEWFNLPLTVRRGGGGGGGRAGGGAGGGGAGGGAGGGGRVVELDRRGVSVEAVKRADDGDGVIVRLCEVYGSRGPLQVKLNVPHGGVWRTDLLERNEERVESAEWVEAGEWVESGDWPRAASAVAGVEAGAGAGSGAGEGEGVGAGDAVRLQLRPFELVTLRFASPGGAGSTLR